MKSNYSVKEQAMFKILDCDHMLDAEPWVAYKAAESICFRLNKQGPAVDSLRRCVNALHNCTCYRMSQAWDAMITL